MSSEKYLQINQDQNPVELLKLIRSIAHKHEDEKGGTMARVEHDLRLYMCYQKPQMTNVDYYKTFKAIRAVVDVHGGRAGFHEGMYKERLREIKTKNGLNVADPATDEMREKAMIESCNEYLGCLFIRNSDEGRYKQLKSTLDNSYLFGKDDYPTSIEDALRMMQNHKPTHPQKTGLRNEQQLQSDGVTFAQTGQGGRQGKGRDASKDKCFNCGTVGRHAKDCQNNAEAGKEKSGTNFFNVDEEADQLEADMEGMLLEEGTDFFNLIEGVGFLGIRHSRRLTCDHDKAYLDTCCTNHTCFAAEHLVNIHDTGVVLRQHCNAGTNLTGKAGFWRNIRFWYNKDGIANLISVPQLESDGYILEYGSKHGWVAHGPDGFTMVFKQDVGLCNGMPYVDMRADADTFIVPTDTFKKEAGVIMVQTVRNNYEGFTKEEVRQAIAAREAQALMAHPSDEALKHLVSSTNAVRNLDITVPAISNARDIFGPDLGAVRGKTVRQRPSAVRPEYVNVPRDLYERIKNVTVTADVMFVNGLPFLVTLSRDIKLGSVEFLPSHTVTQLCNALNKVFLIYRRGGFMIRSCLMDMEFEKLKNQMESVIVNTTAAREHVGDIERYIRVIKERGRSVTSQLPYKKCMPDQIVIHLIKFVVMWLNALPHPSGISQVLSPREIVTSMKLDFKKHCRVKFGAYVEASADEVVTNTMRDRTEECIALGPTGNFQGSVVCFHLDTGGILSRQTIAPLPMPDRIIKKVMSISEHSKQKA